MKSGTPFSRSKTAKRGKHLALGLTGLGTIPQDLGSVLALDPEPSYPPIQTLGGNNGGPGNQIHATRVGDPQGAAGSVSSPTLSRLLWRGSQLADGSLYTHYCSLSFALSRCLSDPFQFPLRAELLLITSHPVDGHLWRPFHPFPPFLKKGVLIFLSLEPFYAGLGLRACLFLPFSSRTPGACEPILFLVLASSSPLIKIPWNPYCFTVGRWLIHRLIDG